MPTAPWPWPNSTITRIVDGDSIAAYVHRDLGFGGVASFNVKLRLNRINTPPLNTQAGRDAEAVTKELLRWQDADPHTPPLLIETFRTYKYGGGDVPEWMAEVTLPDGRNLSDTLVALGAAAFWDGTGPRPGG